MFRMILILAGLSVLCAPAVCKNLSTGATRSGSVRSDAEVDCEALGLGVSSGDRIEITTTGIAALGEVLDVDLDSTTLRIDGANVPYTMVLLNEGGLTLPNMVVQAWIQQGTARRAANGSMVQCGGQLGELPPGHCNDGFSIGARNDGFGSGILEPGRAAAVFELEYQDAQGDSVVDRLTLDVWLVR